MAAPGMWLRKKRTQVQTLLSTYKLCMEGHAHHLRAGETETGRPQRCPGEALQLEWKTLKASEKP